MSAEFVHLHVHSQFSLLDGALRVKDLAARAKALGMPAVALTDHGNMFGAIQFYKACQGAGLSPILGCEVNVARRKSNAPAGSTRPDDTALEHLVLLASNEEGYRNLIRIVSEGHVAPVSEAAPSVTLDTVAAHKGGILGLTGCMGGVVAQRILEEGEQAGRTALERLQSCFDPGNLYVELQDHGLVEQSVLNGMLANAARDMGLPMVASNDCHFGLREDGESHLYLGCIAANRSFATALEGHHGSYEMFLKPPEEMTHLFRDHPEAIRNTLQIAERCQGLKLKLGQPMLPTFAVPDGFDTDSYFRHVSREGLARRFAEAADRNVRVDEGAYRQRLETELDVIVQMRFPGYFLIVWDFIRHAKENSIPVGPGRGSGAGSIVAYALRITDLDPIPYNLLFERFLNPERVSMPDFDIDFCMDRRDQVIAYVAQKYGVTSVGQIATFHELKARSVIKDVGRAMGFPAMEAQKIASLVPQKAPGIMYTLVEALQIEPKLKALETSDPTVGELLKQAQKLEGLTRHAGMHAAGVVISEGALWDHVPCFKNGEQLVTQYDKDDVEAAGLVKFDFLGLKTLTVIDIAVRLINARPDHGDDKRFEPEKIPLTDLPTFQLLQSGETTGVFQLESSGMQQLFKDLRPDAFEDIVAAVALYRPGPLGSGMVKDFVDCKHKRKPIAKMHDLVDEILQPTYGVVVYQEQVMQVAQRLAGYTLGGADLLRRAMGKKKAEEMAKQKATFVAGALGKGVSQEDADRIFALLEYFAGYGFNKCLIGETTVVDADTGTRTTVENLYRRRRHERRPFRVHALGDDGKLHARRVVDVMANGRKPVFELKTAQGKRIIATANHPFRTLDGWTRLDDLGVGDRIAAPRRLAVDTAASWPEHELVTLAGLLSEGNTCHPSCLYFFGNERTLVDDFARAAAQFPGSVARVSTRADGRRHEVCVSTGRDTRFRPGMTPWNARPGIDGGTALAAVAPPSPRSGVFRWAEALGILGRKAGEKRVPAAVFALRDRDIELFLGRLWAGDGYLAGEDQAVPFYATSSRVLAHDVALLLARLGIVSGVHEKIFKYRGAERAGFTVHLVGEGSRETFLERVAPHCVGRQRQVDLLRKHLEGAGGTSKDTIPAAVRSWVDAERRRAGLTWRELETRSGVSTKELQGKGSAKKTGFRRGTIARLGAFLGSARLRALATSDVFWDRVVSIEPRGEAETYDLTVEIDHNFVADGLIVHNSHSAAYALLTYQTAYLKAHFPVEFLCALMTADRDKIDKVVRIIAEGRAWGVNILPPEINESQTDFTVVYAAPGAAASTPTNANKAAELRARKRRAKDPLDPKIRFGLGAIRGVGESALEAVLEVRNAGGAFSDLFDFAERVDARRVNKGVLESLVQCGAFDATLGARGVSRARAFAAVERAIERSRTASKDRESGQIGLFAALGAVATQRSEDYPPAEPWDMRETLVREKQSLGFYVSGHPLERYGVELSRFGLEPTTALATKDAWSRVRVGGMVEGYRERVFKGGGGKVAFFTLEDTQGRVEVKVRQNQIETYAAVLTSNEPVVISGKVSFPMTDDSADDFDSGPKEPTLLLDEAVPLADAIRAETRSVAIKLSAQRADRSHIERLAEVLRACPGACPVSLVIQLDEGEATLSIGRDLRVEPSDAMLTRLEKLFGEKVAELR